MQYKFVRGVGLNAKELFDSGGFFILFFKWKK
jgi:hypothetical protein